MSLDLFAAPAVEPITVADLKLWARLNAGTGEDALLERIIRAARRQAESILQRPLITQTWDQVHDAFPDCDAPIKLERPPVQSIVSVTYLDADLATQTMAPTDYVLDRLASPGGWLYPAQGVSWPGTAAVLNALTIRFVAGFGDAAVDVPEDIVQWILLVATYMYENRSGVDFTGKQQELPARFKDGLLDDHRRYDFG